MQLLCVLDRWSVCLFIISCYGNPYRILSLFWENPSDCCPEIQLITALVSFGLPTLFEALDGNEELLVLCLFLLSLVYCSIHLCIWWRPSFHGWHLVRQVSGGVQGLESTTVGNVFITWVLSLSSITKYDSIIHYIFVIYICYTMQGGLLQEQRYTYR